jgi:broad-specificity NMP kinase
MIIHITGVSGSEKTTLGKKIAKLGILVIDTDEIDDKNAIQILNDKNYDDLFADNLDKFYALKDKMNYADVKKKS